jgi:hypothetical protein
LWLGWRRRNRGTADHRANRAQQKNEILHATG